MPGSPVKIGPFTGGLNTYSDPTMIADGECADLINLDIDLDGSLINRPSIKVALSSGGLGAVLLGTYVSDTEIYYIIRDAANVVRAHTISSGVPFVTIVTADISGVVQYMNKLWLIAKPGGITNGGSWDPVAGFTSVPAVPRGESAAIYKERLFIGSGPLATNGNRVNFSNPANFSLWTPGTDFFDVANGDGQFIVKLFTFKGNIAIFKNRSTYIFGYDATPAKGQVEIVNSSIGLSARTAFVEFENVLYVVFGSLVYSIQNWNWDIINVKVQFVQYNSKSRISSSDVSLSIVGNRLICRYFDNHYVYGLRTKAWSVWRFNKADYDPSFWMRHPNIDAATSNIIYVAGGYDNNDARWYLMQDNPISPYVEYFDINMTTKTYDYNVPYTFKRLFYWGVDLLSKSPVTFLVHPTLYNVPVKWSELKGLKWSSLMTWARPIDISLDVTDSASSANPSGTRVFIRLLKSLRFRQISFRIATTVDGTISTGPFRIFSLTAFTSSKEIVSKKIS